MSRQRSAEARPLLARRTASAMFAMGIFTPVDECTHVTPTARVFVLMVRAMRSTISEAACGGRPIVERHVTNAAARPGCGKTNRLMVRIRGRAPWLKFPGLAGYVGRGRPRRVQWLCSR